MPYLLTKESVSVIRKDAAGVKEAEAAGFALIGECDAAGNLTKPGAAPEIIEKPGATKKKAGK